MNQPGFFVLLHCLATTSLCILGRPSQTQLPSYYDYNQLGDLNGYPTDDYYYMNTNFDSDTYLSDDYSMFIEDSKKHNENTTHSELTLETAAAYKDKRVVWIVCGSAVGLVVVMLVVGILARLASGEYKAIEQNI